MPNQNGNFELYDRLDFFFFNVPKFGNIREFIAFYFENVRKFQFSNIKGFHLDHGKSQYKILNTGDILYRE